VHNTNTYTIFWDPTNNYHSDWQHLIDGFMTNAGSASGSLSNVFAVDAQYTDRSNTPASYKSVFKGAYFDTDAYPSSGCTDPNPFEVPDRLVINETHVAVCVNDEQVQLELRKFISQHKLTPGMSTIFYLLTPPGVAMCLDGGGPTGHCSDYSGAVGGTSYKNSFCSYHSDINPGGLSTGDAGTILYGAIPWSAGGAGDKHLLPNDERIATDCQDGGFDPSTSPPEEPEHAKEKTAKEKEEFEEKTPEEKTKIEEAEELEAGHVQEPNQVGCPSADGGCDTGLADLIINQIAVEQQNIVTNPLLNSWQDAAHNEQSDECRNFFAPVLGGTSAAKPISLAGDLYNQAIGNDNYYLNTAFNDAAATFSYPGVPCIPGVTLEPQFTATNPINSGEPVGFDGMESTITLNAADFFPASGAPSKTYPVYTWNFGDGTPTVTGLAPGSPSQNSPETSPCEAPWIAPCAASTFHSYQYGGTYDVTLTVRDVGGNVASITQEETVSGPSRPAPEPPAPTPGTSSAAAGSSTGSTSSTSSTAKTTTTTAPAPAHAPPVATQAVASHSLSSVLKSGLVIRYSVSEQVAGRFEVLLASSVARKLGIHGTAASGLAKGTAAQTVIAKAILVTTKGGHSSYRLKLSKATAARLRKLPKVSLMIRLVVHNAASPAVTTVLNTVNLSR
jgi:hypothetical protein